jgi:hypothetical protein
MAKQGIATNLAYITRARAMTEKTQDQEGGAPHSAVDELVAKSASTDIQALLSAKESAKRAVLDDPSQANLAALDRATKMLNAAMQAKANLSDWRAVLDYVAENGRKLGKTKLFEDIKRGRLKKQTDGSYRLRDVDRYLASLPMSGTADIVAEKAADRQRRREEEEIRRIKATADKEEFDLAVKKGRYIPKEQVYLELAARAVTLSSGIKTAFESRNLELIAAVGGNPQKGLALTELLESILDEALNEYSREMDFEVTFLMSDEDDPADSAARTRPGVMVRDFSGGNDSPRTPSTRGPAYPGRSGHNQPVSRTRPGVMVTEEDQ